jgi:hypothetical protein
MPHSEYYSETHLHAPLHRPAYPPNGVVVALLAMGGVYLSGGGVYLSGGVSVYHSPSLFRRDVPSLYQARYTGQKYSMTLGTIPITNTSFHGRSLRHSLFYNGGTSLNITNQYSVPSTRAYLIISFDLLTLYCSMKSVEIPVIVHHLQ